MERIILKIAEEPGSDECTLCGQPTLWTKGPRLVLADGAASVCRSCVKKQAPAYVALLDLADIADKVGKQCRHLLTPPMESLLDLARAAENYSTSGPKQHVRAG